MAGVDSVKAKTQVGHRLSLSTVTATGKDLVSLLRDSFLLLFALLLIVWPTAFNNILVNAGFEEGSFAGLKWKKNLTQTDEQLVSAQATIADLKLQNEKLNQALAEAKAQIASPSLKAQISSLEQINQQLIASSSKVQEAVGSTISENTPLVQKVESSTGTSATWGVVFGGDTNLESANYEIHTAAPKLGIDNAAIYYRQGSYRSVAVGSDRSQAEQILNKARRRRSDAYIVNMDTWCPNRKEQSGYVECSQP